jgi:hypothetical protein
MAKAYSVDMRQRVIDRVEGGASRREAAEHYEVSPQWQDSDRRVTQRNPRPPNVIEQ